MTNDDVERAVARMAIRNIENSLRNTEYGMRYTVYGVWYTEYRLGHTGFGERATMADRADNA